jgi:hypothetical protein
MQRPGSKYISVHFNAVLERMAYVNVFSVCHKNVYNLWIYPFINYHKEILNTLSNIVSINKTTQKVRVFQISLTHVPMKARVNIS